MRWTKRVAQQTTDRPTALAHVQVARQVPSSRWWWYVDGGWTVNMEGLREFFLYPGEVLAAKAQPRECGRDEGLG